MGEKVLGWPKCNWIRSQKQQPSLLNCKHHLGFPSDARATLQDCKTRKAIYTKFGWESRSLVRNQWYASTCNFFPSLHFSGIDWSALRGSYYFVMTWGLASSIRWFRVPFGLYHVTLDSPYQVLTSHLPPTRQSIKYNMGLPSRSIIFHLSNSPKHASLDSQTEVILIHCPLSYRSSRTIYTPLTGCRWGHRNRSWYISLFSFSAYCDSDCSTITPRQAFTIKLSLCITGAWHMTHRLGNIWVERCLKIISQCISLRYLYSSTSSYCSTGRNGRNLGSFLWEPYHNKLFFPPQKWHRPWSLRVLRVKLNVSWWWIVMY